MDDLKQLIQIASSYPLTLLVIVIIALTAQRRFAFVAAVSFSLLGLWGLYNHFESNFSWYMRTLEDIKIIKAPANPLQAEELVSYARGIYHALALLIAATLILLPLFLARRRA